ncbi:MAG: hypothetical protein K6F59_02530 [Gammaproteobacteria bacterium]|nr:hypothetical protein [Gammaproteobacteria bacterium]
MFKGALEGVKKLYYSAICSLATTAFSVGAALFAILGIDGSSTFSVLVAGLFGGVALILALAALIFEILGCYECSKEKQEFKYALYAAIAAIIFTGVAAIFAKAFIGSVLDFLGSISSFLVTILIIRGLMSMFKDLDDTEMIEKGKKVLLIHSIAYVSAAVIEFLSGILKKLEVKVFVVTLLSLIAGIIAIISIVFYLTYIKESITHLDFSTFKPQSQDVVETQVVDIEENKE